MNPNMKNIYKAGALILLAMALLLGIGCYSPTYNRLIEAPILPSPNIERVPVTVGVYYSPEFKTYVHRQYFKLYTPGAIIYEEQTVTEVISLGPASVALFDQVFKSLFEKTVILKNKPTHGEQIPGVDAIIEPSIGQYNLGFPHLSPHKAKVEIEYQIVLYSPHDGNIGFWSAKGMVEKTIKFIVFGLAVWPKVLTQEAMREAAGNFLISFYDNAGVQNWINSLEHSSKNSGEE